MIFIYSDLKTNFVVIEYNIIEDNIFEYNIFENAKFYTY